MADHILPSQTGLQHNTCLAESKIIPLLTAVIKYTCSIVITFRFPVLFSLKKSLSFIPLFIRDEVKILSRKITRIWLVMVPFSLFRLLTFRSQQKHVYNSSLPLADKRVCTWNFCSRESRAAWIFYVRVEFQERATCVHFYFIPHNT